MSSKLIVPLEILAHGEGLEIPAYATEESAGMDLRAAISESVYLKPGARVLIPCGFSMKLPSGHEAQIRARSGLALNYGIAILNAPGTIDADYTGEIKAILINHGDKIFEITRGMRVAQLIISPVLRAELAIMPSLKELTEYESNKRKEGGFGSTGLT